MLDASFPLLVEPTSEPTQPGVRSGLLVDPVFGRVFTDHMVTARWTVERGWHDARLGRRQALALDPACAALHYAQEVFEGLKAYRTAGDAIALFRPEQNARRLARSAERLAMPAVPEALFLNAVRTLVEVDRDWVPGTQGSLYIRPFVIAAEAALGVRPSAEYLFCAIACPVGPYFKGGDKALSLWVADKYVRAAPGGTGEAKCGGNYAAGLLAQAEAASFGCDQVVFLDAVEHRWVEELGGMNLFFVMQDGQLVTPPLGGTILPGITRDSIITLARDRGLSVDERPYAIQEWIDDVASGRLAEAFACGTAATIAGIGRVSSSTQELVVGDGEVGPLTAALRDELLGMQRGAVPDRHGWLVEL